MGIVPSALPAGSLRGMLDMHPQLLLDGDAAKSINTVSSLRLSNLRPSSPAYYTLEQVGCKLLTVDSAGHLQLVNYQPERCQSTATPAVCGSLHTQSVGNVYLPSVATSDQLCAS